VIVLDQPFAGMAFECHGPNQVDDLQLSDMLDLSDPARAWGLMEHEKA